MAEVGASYRVVQGPDQAFVSDIVAVRDGNDLVLHLADGATVVIEEFLPYVIAASAK